MDSGSSQTAGAVFVDSTGRPLQVFVETSEFAYRPKLVRSLRKGGAAIAHYPTDAEIILVDLDTDAGKQCINDWVAEADKVLLDWRWARESIERGKALLAPDGWGGFRITEATKSTASGSAETEQSPLPTPRHTPPEAGLSDQTTTPTLSSSTSRFAASSTAASSQSASAPQPNAFAVPLPQAVPNPFQLALQPNNVFAFPQGFPGQQMQNPTQAAWVAMMIEAMRQQGVNTGDLQNFLAQMNQASMPQRATFPTDPSQLGQFVNLVMPFANALQSGQRNDLAANDFMNAASASVSAPQTPFRHSATPDAHGSSSNTPAPSHLPPSLKRKTSLSDNSSSISSKSKGKGRATSPPESDRPLKSARKSTTPGQSIQPVSAGPSDRRLSAPHEGDLFTTEEGRPLVFWVQMECKKRSDLLHTVKKNGGKIVAEMHDADIVVLAQNSKPFEHWMKLADQSEKPAVKTAFIYDCISENTLLSYESYGFEAYVARPKRGRPPINPRKSPQKTPNKRSPQKVGTPTAAVKRVAQSNGKTKAGPAPSDDAAQNESASAHTATFGHRERSPTPPSGAPEAWQNGKNLYTQSDRDYFMRYVPVLLSREPTMSAIAIAGKMFDKLPHHTLGSWRSWTARQNEAIDKFRRRAYITHRKVERELERRTPQTESAREHASAPSTSPEEQHLESEEDKARFKSEFNNITAFLADGAADNVTDDVFWASLAEKYPSRTVDGWKEFWTNHGHLVVEEVSRIRGSQEDSTPGQQNKAENKDAVTGPSAMMTDSS